MFGFSGGSLITGAVESCAKRSTGEEISAYPSDRIPSGWPILFGDEFPAKARFALDEARSLGCREWLMR